MSTLVACSGLFNVPRPITTTDSAFGVIDEIPTQTFSLATTHQSYSVPVTFHLTNYHLGESINLTATATDLSLFDTEPYVENITVDSTGSATVKLAVPAGYHGSSNVTILLNYAGNLIERTFGVFVGTNTGPTGLEFKTIPVILTKNVAVGPFVGLPATSGTTFSSCNSIPTLPLGLNLIINGAGLCEISGTPTVLSAMTIYRVTAATPAAQVFQGDVAISVVDALPTNLTFSASPAVFTRGTAIVTLRSSHGGGALVTCGISGTPAALPAGLNLALVTGECEISGTPTQIMAANNYTITAINSGGSTSALVNLTVRDIAPTSISFSVAGTLALVQGTAMTPLDAANGIGGPLTSCTVAAGTLPPGISLTLTAGQCRLSGTPTTVQSAASVTMRASNSGGYAEDTFSISVAPAAPATLAFSGTPFSFIRNTAITTLTSTHTGGTISSCDVTAGTLPAGLSVGLAAGECTISGTPTAVQSSASVTIRALNVSGQATAAVNFTVNEIAPTALSFSPASYTWAKSATVASSVTTHTGGPLTGCAITGTPAALPAGLSLALSSGDCVISGTPTAVTANATYTVRGSNSGGSTTASVTITINDAAPTSLAYSGSSYTFTKDLAITALDSTSSGGTITSCSVQSGSLPAGLTLALVSNVCRISGTPTAVQTATAVTLRATNSGGSVDVTLTLTVNDASPTGVGFSGSPFTFTISTSAGNHDSSAGTGGAITNCAADAGTPLPAGLSVSLVSGVCRISGTPTVLSASTSYTINYTNSGGPAGTSVSIAVVDVQPLGINFGSAYTFTKNPAITAVATTHTGGQATSCTGTLPTGLAWSVVSGECQLSGTPTVVNASATSYTLSLTNSGGSATKSFTIAVNDIAPTSLAYSASSYTYTKNSAITAIETTHGGGSLTACSVLSGTLPAGLTVSLVSDSCRISGTPTTVQAATSVTIRSTNSGGNSDVALSFTVDDIIPTALAFSQSTYTFTKGTAITSQTSTHSGGTLTACSAQTTLPTGLSIALTSGECVLSGTPTTVTASASYTIRATNSGGNGDVTLTIIINDTAPTALAFTGSPFVYTKGTAITALNSTHSGGTITSCAITGTPASLPAGLSLALASGECKISGMPTAITAVNSYTVQASNTGGSVSATALSITVNDAVPAAVAFASSPFTFTKGTAIASAYSGAGTGGAITSCSAPGGLPAGLSIGASSGLCVLSGTPTAIVAATSYTVRSSNSGGNYDASITITVNDAAPSSLAFGASSYTWSVTGSAITSQTTTHSGGTITSCALSGTPSSMPAGLTLGLSGGQCVISGTPTTYTASQSYTIQATNSGGSTTVAVTILITAKPLLIYAAATGTAGSALSISPATFSSQGAALTACAIKSGSPNAAAFTSAGLSVNASTCAISGTPGAALAATMFTIVASNSVGNSSDATISITISAAGSCTSTAFGGGDGSAGTPFLVCHPNHFNLINANSTSRSKSYKMTTNIDMTGATFAGMDVFTGTFDGAYHTISNYSNATDNTVDTAGNQTGGFFWNLTGGTIERVLFTNVSFGGCFDGNLGAIGTLNGGTIYQVGVVSGTINPTGCSHEYTGGLVGYASGGTIRESFNRAVVKGQIVGALAGLIDKGTEMYDNYARGSIDGDGSFVGALDAAHTADTYGGLKNNYWAGAVVTGHHTDGLIEGGTAMSFATGNVFDTTVTGVATSSYGTALTTAQMKTPTDTRFSAWEQVHVWDLIVGQYPKLKWEPYTGTCSASAFAGGDGSTANPYQICRPEQLNLILDDTTSQSKAYILLGDLDMTGQSWVPTGKFTGSFDGNYHNISNFTTALSSEDDIGLFATVHDGTVKNLRFTNINLASTWVRAYGGAAAGRVEGTAVITNIGVDSGSISSAFVAGGLVGRLSTDRNSIVNSYSNANVTAVVAGGITGGLLSGGITNSYSKGVVKVANGVTDGYRGGIAGDYNTGTNTAYLSLTNNYFAGSFALGTGSAASATAPSIYPNSVGATVTNSGNVFDKATTGYSTDTYATGLTTSEMKTSSTASYSAWSRSTSVDATKVWYFPVGYYPLLQWQP